MSIDRMTMISFHNTTNMSLWIVVLSHIIICGYVPLGVSHYNIWYRHDLWIFFKCSWCWKNIIWCDCICLSMLRVILSLVHIWTFILIVTHTLLEIWMQYYCSYTEQFFFKKKLQWLSYIDRKISNLRDILVLLTSPTTLNKGIGWSLENLWTCIH